MLLGVKAGGGDAKIISPLVRAIWHRLERLLDKRRNSNGEGSIVLPLVDADRYHC